MRALSDQVASEQPLSGVRVPTDWLTRPDWLVPGALVLVYVSTGKGQTEVRRVTDIEFPWLVWFEGSRGATHTRNVLSLAHESA